MTSAATNFEEVSFLIFKEKSIDKVWLEKQEGRWAVVVAQMAVRLLPTKQVRFRKELYGCDQVVTAWLTFSLTIRVRIQSSSNFYIWNICLLSFIEKTKTKKKRPQWSIVKKTIQFFATNYRDKSRIWCWDLNPRPLEQDYFRITTT